MTSQMARIRRNWPLVLLVLANLASTCVLMTGAMRLNSGGGSGPLWPIVVVGGCVSGQATLLALWFGLAREAVWFRALMVVFTLAVFHAAWWLFRAFDMLRLRTDINWSNWHMYLWQDVWLGMRWGVPLFLLAWLVILPIRRLRGVYLGSIDSAGEEDSLIGRFQILDIMKYTGLVALFLLLLRLAPALNPLIAGAALLVQGCFMFLAWILFRAAMMERRALFWLLGTVVFLGAVALLLWQGAWLIDKATGSELCTVLDLRVMETFVLAVGSSVGLNVWALRKSGLRLRWVTKSGKEPASGMAINSPPNDL